MLHEMRELQEYLETHGFYYVRIKNQTLNQIVVLDENGEKLWDVICNKGSYGYEQGLLELSGSLVTDDEIAKNLDTVIGYLTAAEVIDRIEKSKREAE